MFKKLSKAVTKYDKWKSKHNPNHKPWANPEQVAIPKIDWNDILPLNGVVTADAEESQINEKDLEKMDDDDDK